MKEPCAVLLRPDFGSDIAETYKQANPPIGLGYLASCLESAGIKAYIVDLARKNITVDTLVEFIARCQPLFIGISALTAYYNGMKALSNQLRQKAPGSRIVLGGVHPSALPRESLIECSADFVVVGEGERTIVELARELQKDAPDFSAVDGIVYRRGEDIVWTKDRALIANLDEIPFPSWHKIDPNKYPRVPHGIVLKHKEFAAIVSTRGCPYDCAYCSSCQFWRRKIRFRSPTNVVDEIQYLHEQFGIREIHFWDDNLTLRRDHIVGICREIVARGLNGIAYGTPNGLKVDTLDEPLLRLMRRAGFYELTFAVESASIGILRANGKQSDLVKILRNTVIARRLGFLINSYFLIGFPQDTAGTIEKTIRYAVSVPFTYSLFFLLKPLPGSRIFAEWARGKDMLDYDWGKLTSYTQMNEFTLGNMSPAALFKAQKNAFRRKIFRIPDFITIALLTIKYYQPSQIKFKVSTFKNFFMKLLT